MSPPLIRESSKQVFGRSMGCARTVHGGRDLRAENSPSDDDRARIALTGRHRRINVTRGSSETQCSRADPPSGGGAKPQEGRSPRDEVAHRRASNTPRGDAGPYREPAQARGRRTSKEAAPGGMKPLKGENPGKPRAACQANPCRAGDGLSEGPRPGSRAKANGKRVELPPTRRSDLRKGSFEGRKP
jgi:hypothetical protein